MEKKIPDIYSSDDPTVRVGLCQVYTQQWDIDGNTERALDALHTAAEKGAELAITPECVFHGYGFDNDVEVLKVKYAAIADTVESPRIRAVRDCASKYKMYVIVGFLEDGGNGIFHNSAAMIAPDGEVINVYRKVHCRDFESIEHNGAYTPGDRFSTFTMKGADAECCIGTLICFDREIPEATRSLRALGAEIIACPLACDTERLDVFAPESHNETVTQTRCAENEVFYVVVNHAGRFNGGSFVVGPGGKSLLQLDADPEVCVIELPVVTAREKLQSNAYGWMGWGYRRPDVYDKYLKS